MENKFLLGNLNTAHLRQLMLSPYVVIHAAPWSRDAVHMVALCVYCNLYGISGLASEPVFKVDLNFWVRIFEPLL